ncbi:hypothetical protein [Pontiella sulfatireligans]|uniref:Alginate export domain-containing protein n=1 Tax=Pontiella sulfatireligans TaxID=2750658 RepID=A0A6C2URN0_9BACT|nr:hypothetical protein [Pontiella sulfatireligans]VGO22990.1 hypothetical protein SCARR_05089 [Pontiella sulfatireligans]
MLNRINVVAFIFLTAGLWNTNTFGIEVGPLEIGGAMRVNYIRGDYTETGGDEAQRGDNGGNFELDTFRINLDYNQGPFTGKAEYRWYDGYNFLHTGWLGYNFEEAGQVQVGLNRVPFGVGPYGPANNWFFDLHYYVGLSDDMDYGIKYSVKRGDLALDFAYYLRAEHSFVGDSKESARYSYDIVDNGSDYSAYKEKNQLNARCVYSILEDSAPTDIGVSLQVGQLDADNARAKDSMAYAGAIHSKSSFGAWGLMLQCSKYKYDADYKDPALTDDLIVMGAYDYPAAVATEGTIPSVALSYNWKVDKPWADSITFYNDFSVLIKDGETASGESFNDSAMNVLGMAIANGGWYIYVDYAYASGNFFIGDEGDFGANLDDDWQSRFNVNFGYYF